MDHWLVCCMCGYEGSTETFSTGEGDEHIESEYGLDEYLVCPACGAEGVEPDQES